MERIAIKKCEPGDEKGCWEHPEGMEAPIVYCPDCGGGLLGGFSTHRFEKNGDVNASVVCPCGFHKFINLSDFNTKA